MSASEYREYLRTKKLSGGPRERKSKYNARVTRIAGEDRSFPSRGEADAFRGFRTLERLGAIRDLKRYPSVSLTRAGIRFKPDWSYVDAATGEFRYVDFKGVEDARFRLIKKLWKYYGPAPLEIWRGNPAHLTETIRPNPRAE